jgi:hypothetical protein
MGEARELSNYQVGASARCTGQSSQWLLTLKLTLENLLLTAYLRFKSRCQDHLVHLDSWYFREVCGVFALETAEYAGK